MLEALLGVGMCTATQNPWLLFAVPGLVCMVGDDGWQQQHKQLNHAVVVVSVVCRVTCWC
jgi:hypothetical protein